MAIRESSSLMHDYNKAKQNTGHEASLKQELLQRNFQGLFV